MTCIALKQGPVNIRWQGICYFEYGDSYFCAILSIECIFKCYTGLYKSANFMVGALQKCCPNRALLKAL